MIKRWFEKLAFNVHPLDILLGSEEYRSTLHHFEETAVALPERIYPVRVSFYDRVWKRARWPFAKKIRQAEIGLPRPIPVPGKGESSWDMDDDAVCSMSIPAMTLDDAILALLNSVNKARVRYGGPAWVPVTQMELEN